MPERRRFGCVLVPLLFMAACGESSQPTAPTAPTPQPPTSKIVAGRVIDVQRSQPIAGVELSWQAALSSVVTRTTTNADGIYRVELPIADRYSVSGAVPVGLVAGNRIISALVLVPGVFLLSDFLINSGGCPLWYGVVTDARTGQPVAGATVSWFGVQSTSSTLGEYRLFQPCRQPTPPGVIPPFGTTSIGVTHPAYLRFTQIPGPRAESIGFGQGETRQDYPLTPR
jgi:hypothetical protein